MESGIDINSDPNGSTINEDEILEAETSLGIKIPLDLKNMLNINGYNTLRMISEITEREITEIQLFAREVLPEIINNSEYEDYYGLLFKKFPQKYTIMSGHKKTLNLLKIYYEKKSLKKIQIQDTRSSRSTSSTSSSRAESTARSTAETVRSSVRDRSKSRSPIQVKNTHLAEECASIGKAVNLWIRNSCDENQWEYFRTITNDIIVNCTFDSTTELKCEIVCFCGNKVKISRNANKPNQRKRWIFSNFHRHFKVHLNNKNRITKKSGHTSIQHYFSNKTPLSQKLSHSNSFTNIAETESTSEKQINIIQDVSLKIPEIDTCPSICPSQGPSSSNNIPLEISLPLSNDEIESTPSEILLMQNMNYNQETAQETDNFESVKRDNQCQAQTSLKTKWSSNKYSRRERSRRKREVADDHQLLITNFLPLIERFQGIITADSEISQLFLKNMSIYDGHNSENDSEHSLENHEKLPSLEAQDNSSRIGKFLEILIDVSKKNATVSSNRNVFDDVVKKIALYIYYIGGKLLYETLYSNMQKTLPSLSTLSRYINKHGRKIQEGIFDFEGLNNFLVQRNLPKFIWIGEDATRISPKIEYDSVSNKIMGFSLPLTKEGIPKIDAFIAHSAEHIRQYFMENEKANYAYAIMAQPIIPNAPSYCLSIFATNNKFTYEHIINRWKFLQGEADKYDIKILGFSSDGDTRLLKGMRLVSNLSKTQHHESWKWFHMGKPKISGCSFVQDSVHIGTKLRTRLLKPSIILPLGKFLATPSHLQVLISEFSKDKHLLIPSDLKPEDKMNFRSAEKMYSDRVRELLKFIPDTIGTQAYLLVMQYSVTAYCDETLNIHIRIYRLWYAVFFLRIWKRWIIENDQYTVKDNFISQNCHVSIELNAHSLINLVQDFNILTDLDDTAFTTWLYSSQVCEKLFRATRSMTSTFSTVVNYSIKDIINRTNRISAINFILNDLNEEIIFPREARRKISDENVTKVKGLCDRDIERSVENALADAITTTSELGMVVEHDSWFYMDLVSDMAQDEMSVEREQTHLDDNEEISIDDGLTDITNNDADAVLGNIMQNEVNIIEDNITEEILDLSKIASIKDSLHLKDFTNHKDKISKKSIFAEVIVGGKKMIVKKSSLCWLFDQMGEKVSSDRLRRFISKNTKQRPAVLKCPQPSPIARKNIIQVGDWCIFSIDQKFPTVNSSNILNGVIGRILAFKYLTGKNRSYSMETAPVSISINRPKRGLGCLCSWYTVDQTGILNQIICPEQSFWDVSNYMATISQNIFLFDETTSELMIQGQTILDELRKFTLDIPGEIAPHSEDSENCSEVEMVLDDSSEVDDFSSKEDEEIEEEMYYAAYYDNQWYIGRVIGKEKGEYKMKFLKENLGTFYWPKSEDLDFVKRDQIFHGPLRMIGCDPLSITISDKENIEKKYRSMKKTH